MSQNKTLIVFETKRGITEKSANKIAEVLRSQFHLDVDVINLAEQDTPDLAPVPKCGCGWRCAYG